MDIDRIDQNKEEPSRPVLQDLFVHVVDEVLINYDLQGFPIAIASKQLLAAAPPNDLINNGV